MCIIKLLEFSSCTQHFLSCNFVIWSWVFKLHMIKLLCCNFVISSFKKGVVWWDLCVEVWNRSHWQNWIDVAVQIHNSIVANLKMCMPMYVKLAKKIIATFLWLVHECTCQSLNHVFVFYYAWVELVFSFKWNAKGLQFVVQFESELGSAFLIFITSRLAHFILFCHASIEIIAKFQVLAFILERFC